VKDVHNQFGISTECTGEAGLSISIANNMLLSNISMAQNRGPSFVTWRTEFSHFSAFVYFNYA